MTEPRRLALWLALLALPLGCATTLEPHPGAAGPAPAFEPIESTAALAELPAEIPVETREWSFASHPGVLITTPHFDIHTTIQSERIRSRIPIFLETALFEYMTAFGPMPAPRSRMQSFIFQDRRQWSAKTRQVIPDQANTFQNLGRGGFSTRGISVLYYIGRRDTFAIAAHEGWHQYTQSTFKDPLPIWLEEGIATYMEGFRYRDETRPVFHPQRNYERRRALSDAVRYDRLIGLEELLSKTPQAFLRDGKGRLLTYYAQVWALTRFLAEYDDGRYLDALERVLRDAADGDLHRTLVRSPAVIAHGGRRQVGLRRTGPWVILGYFNSDLPEFESQYLEYLHRLAG